MTTSANTTPKPSALALLPLILFLILFIGSGVYFTLEGVDYAFYQLPAHVAILPAVILAIGLSRERLNTAIEQLIRGMGHGDIIAMCLIYLLAGAFSSVADATGGVEATVNLGLALIPESLILPGLFVIAAFISTAMGTSMGTIAALAPFALNMATATGQSPAVMAGVLLSGAMFGDNLSFISDTTIAATRSQGCSMRDKFKENVGIAIPAAIAAIILFVFNNQSAPVEAPESINYLAVIPYLSIIVLALAGLNVFVVLTSGILLAMGVGLMNTPDFTLMTFSQEVKDGFASMQEIFVLSLMIGGIAELMRCQGGLIFLTNTVNKVIVRFQKNQGQHHSRASEFGIALLVSFANLCTANNTVAIVVSGQVAKNIATEHSVPAKRSASLLDIFSCVVQGMIPYGAQILLLGASFGLSPLVIVSHSYYCFFLAASALIAVSSRHWWQARRA
jgi:Na+/H+ antiporter NhaC